jgi:tetratricopeptide (TPR) repeat protein
VPIHILKGSLVLEIIFRLAPSIPMPSAEAALGQSASSRRLAGINWTILTGTQWFAPVVIALAAFVLYGRTLGFDFVSDDIKQVIENPFVRNPHLWRRIFTTPVWAFQGRAVQTNFYRPLQIFCYWLLDRLAGPQPFAFHLLNLAIYSASAVLLFYIGVRLFGSRLPAFLGALLWAVHPLHVEAAAWVAALPDLGFGFFYLLAFLVFLRTEQGEYSAVRGYALTAIAFFPALFFKEAAVSFPLILVAFWIFRPTGGLATSLKQRVLGLAFTGLALGVVAGIRILTLGHLLGGRGTGGFDLSVLTSAAGLLGENAKIFFFPFRLSMYRTFAPTGNLRDPWTMIALLMVLSAVAFRRRFPRIAFLIIWWFVALLPCLDIHQLSLPFVADRFSYIPSMGLCLALSALAADKAEAELSNSRNLRLGTAFAVIVAGFWAFQTSCALPMWQSDQSLTRYSMKLYPNNAGLHLVAGWKLEYVYGDLAGADREFHEVLELNRSSARPVKSVAYEALLSLGQDCERRGQIPEALQYFNQAIQLIPNFSEAYQTLGSFYFPRRDYPRAAAYFEKAVKLNPLDPSTHFYLGMCWLRMGLYRQAADQLRAARHIDPAMRGAYLEEAEALSQAGDEQAAARVRRLLPKP